MLNPESFWAKQLFRLIFGLICAGPFLIKADSANYFLPTLVFIIIILPILRCKIFFNLWNKYIYFKRACMAMLATRLCKMLIIFLFGQRFDPIDAAIVYIGLILDDFLSFLLLKFLPDANNPDFWSVISIGFSAYVVLWALIGIFFYVQVIFHYIRHGKWEYK